MNKEELISISEFCSIHEVEGDFIDSLLDAGLLEVTIIEEENYITHDQLFNLEKITRLHYDLDINIAGIEAITHLLKKVEDMQKQINTLHNRLRLYE